MSTEQPGYSERDAGPTTEQTGGDPEALERETSGGGRAHTPPGEHPAGEGPRSGRDVGGPTAAEGQEGEPGTPPGGRGDRPTEGFEGHA